MSRAGRWISLLSILALVPRLGLSVSAADRQEVSPETRAFLPFWWSSAALAVLVGLAEIYVGATVVSRRHKGLGLVWAMITILLNSLIVPLSLTGLQAEPFLGDPRLVHTTGRLERRTRPAFHPLRLRLPLGRCPA
jgi:hypothetical protein